MVPGCPPVPASNTNQLTTEQKKATAYDAVARVPMLEQPAAWKGALSKHVLHSLKHQAMQWSCN